MATFGNSRVKARDFSEKEGAYAGIDSFGVNPADPQDIKRLNLDALCVSYILELGNKISITMTSAPMMSGCGNCRSHQVGKGCSTTLALRSQCCLASEST